MAVKTSGGKITESRRGWLLLACITPICWAFRQKKMWLRALALHPCDWKESTLYCGCQRGHLSWTPRSFLSIIEAEDLPFVLSHEPVWGLLRCSTGFCGLRFLTTSLLSKAGKCFTRKGKAKANRTYYPGDSRALCRAASPQAGNLFASWDTTPIKDGINAAMTSTSSKLQMKARTVWHARCCIPYQTAVLTRIALETD